MSKTTTLETVRERMKTIQGLKASEMEKLQHELNEASEDKAHQKKILDDAVRTTDFEEYHKAKNSLAKLNTKIEMLEARKRQLQKKESHISEMESDKVIDSLLEYENELSEQLAKSISGQLAELQRINNNYRENIREIEEVIREWTSTVHSNYLDRHNYRRRLDTPREVHTVAYYGSPLSAHLNKLLSGELAKYFKNE